VIPRLGESFQNGRWGKGLRRRFHFHALARFWIARVVYWEKIREEVVDTMAGISFLEGPPTNRSWDSRRSALGIVEGAEWQRGCMRPMPALGKEEG